MEFEKLNQLTSILTNLLSINNDVRKSAESYLNSIKVQPGFSILLLKLINSACVSNSVIPTDVAVRQSAAVLFKNLVKKHWNPPEDEESVSSIQESEKTSVKQIIVDLMCIAQPDVQKQLAEAVNIIAQHDFPQYWTDLLPQLVSKLQGGDFHITKGVMMTANSIMKRFRYVFKSDELYTDLKFCLETFQAPLTMQYQITAQLIDQYSNDKKDLPILVELLETLRLMSRIFFSLNWQDIPEYFEDNVDTWMTLFQKFLVYKNADINQIGDAHEPGPLEKLQAAILDNLNIYVTKYEEIFEKFLPHFTQLVWSLLMEVSADSKYDILATTAIKFLTAICSKQMNQSLFNDDVLRDIVEHIVVKNLIATESDEEMFEMNPTDFIRKDMEGSDQDTRRRCATELVRTLLKFFNVKVSELCVTYISKMLQLYQTNHDWKAKDTALNLVLAVSLLSSSSVSGAGEINPNVNILSIFESHIIPEIQDMNVDIRPMVKADAIKVIYVFRSHLPVELILNIFAHLIRHLTSSHVVIQTYAAICIEKFLSLKDRTSLKDPVNVVNKTQTRMTKEHLMPFFEPLFSGLFNVLQNPDLPENDYVMKCIMRVLVVVGTDIGPVLELVLQSLIQSLERVCKNPINPYFNHFLFESVAILIRSTTSRASGGLQSDFNQINQVCDRFENLLFPSFQIVLTQDVKEFIPYVFQIFAQLLGSRPEKNWISDAYKALFPLLLSPILWEHKGNIPALTELFKVYISKGMKEIVSGNYLTGVLGIFQKLLSNKSSEGYAFSLLNLMYSNASVEVMLPFLSTIMNLILHRLQESKVEHKSRLGRMFFENICIYCSCYDCKSLYDCFESITPGLMSMLILKVWFPNAADFTANIDAMDMKHITLGGCKLLFESPIIMIPETWSGLSSILSNIVFNLPSNLNYTLIEARDDDEEDGVKDFDNAYSKLAYCQIDVTDPHSENIPPPADFFAMKFAQLCASHPGQYTALYSRFAKLEEQQELQKVLKKHNLNLA